MSLLNLPADSLAQLLEDRFRMAAVNERIAAAHLLRSQASEIERLRSKITSLEHLLANLGESP